MPQLIDHAGVAPTVLIAAGGLLYSVGARSTRSSARTRGRATFGFHEVFHTLVTAAAVVHFVAIAGWVVPVGA